MTAQWDRLRAAIDKLPPDWAGALRGVCDDLQAGRALSKRQHAALVRIRQKQPALSAVWDLAYVLRALHNCGGGAWDYAGVTDALACAERAQ